MKSLLRLLKQHNIKVVTYYPSDAETDAAVDVEIKTGKVVNITPYAGQVFVIYMEYKEGRGGCLFELSKNELTKFMIDGKIPREAI